MLLFLMGCTAAPPTQIQRIVLIAPFEGRYRQIGYQSLYATRLAISETKNPNVSLLALDDGGTPITTQNRIKAINQDPLVSDVILVGTLATYPEISDLLRNDITPHIVGEWHTSTNILGGEKDFVCGDLCLFPSIASVIATGTTEPKAPSTVDRAFAEKYTSFDPFAPEPLPLAQQVYETTTLLLNR